jgi:hypothetical protein
VVPASLRVQLLKAKEAAEAANHANGEFLANISRFVEEYACWAFRTRSPVVWTGDLSVSY